MNVCTRQLLVPFVLCAMGIGMLFLGGCSREEKQEPSASSPSVYMNDPEFRKQLSDKRLELQAIVKERAPLVARMEELVKEHGEKLAELQKIPEWGELHRKVTALNAKYEEVRKRQLVVAARRLNPQAGKQASGDAPSADKEVSK